MRYTNTPVSQFCIRLFIFLTGSRIGRSTCLPEKICQDFNVFFARYDLLPRRIGVCDRIIDQSPFEYISTVPSW